VALVLLAPLPLGSVYPLAWALMAAIVGVLLIAHSLVILFRGQEITQRPSLMWSWLVPFFAAAAWAALQATSLTPSAWHHPLWAEASAALETHLAGSVSLNPFETISALLRLLTYAGVFWLALNLCRAPQRAEAVFFSVSVAGLAYAAYGLFDVFTDANMVLWYPKPAQYTGDVTSTFINRNNYATYAGLGLICASGLIIKPLSEILESTSNRRVRAIELIEALSGGGWLLICAWMVLITALLLTDSRGGVFASLVGLLALVAAVASSKTVKRHSGLAIAGLILLGGVAFVGFSGEMVGERLADTTLETEERPIIYELTMKGIARSPWLGTGYGTFAEAFRFDRDERVRGYWDKSHNTYLENALELGVPAATLLTLACAALFLRCLLGVLKRRRHIIYPAIGVGATVLVAVHSFVDFGLQIPAITATYALIMGAAVAQSWRSAELMGSPNDPVQ
jgi:O-antigen ligase